MYDWSSGQGSIEAMGKVRGIVEMVSSEDGPVFAVRDREAKESVILTNLNREQKATLAVLYGQEVLIEGKILIGPDDSRQCFVTVNRIEPADMGHEHLV